VSQLALTGGTIYPSPAEAPLRDGVVLIEDGTIVAVGDVAMSASVPALDCSGLTITAGFWNSHVHFFERKWADAAAIPAPELARQLRDTFTRHGFTSVFDTGDDIRALSAVRYAVRAGKIIHGP